MLDNIDFFWSAHDIGWYDRFLDFQATREKAGHFDIPYGDAKINDCTHGHAPYLEWIKQQWVQ